MKLARAVDVYIERKQSAGCKYTSPGRILLSFSRQLGNVALASIVPAQVSAFLNGPRTGVPTWRCKRGTLRVFFEYWALRGRVKTSPLPPNVPKCTSIFVPHIYSHAELHRLLDATAISQRGRSCVMDARTFRTLLLFLYGTGMRLGEAVKLKCSEVDLNTGVITVRDTKFYKSRLVPLGRDVHELLRQYLLSPRRRRQRGANLFSAKNGEPIKIANVEHCFKRLRRHAGIVRRDVTSYQPRIHDLRHTFAVHRLTAWYKQGADVQRLLPALSTYLGHVELKSTQRYLTMTPELLRQANIRFESYVRGGGHDDR